jgi:hypothetical protein
MGASPSGVRFDSSVTYGLRVSLVEVSDFGNGRYVGNMDLELSSIVGDGGLSTTTVHPFDFRKDGDGDHGVVYFSYRGLLWHVMGAGEAFAKFYQNENGGG